CCRTSQPQGKPDFQRLNTRDSLVCSDPKGCPTRCVPAFQPKSSRSPRTLPYLRDSTLRRRWQIPGILLNLPPPSMSSGLRLPKLRRNSGSKRSNDVCWDMAEVLVLAFKEGSDFAHKSVHLLLDLKVRLQTDVEIKNDLSKACGFDLVQRINDLRRRAK